MHDAWIDGAYSGCHPALLASPKLPLYPKPSRPQEHHYRPVLAFSPDGNWIAVLLHRADKRRASHTILVIDIMERLVEDVWDAALRGLAQSVQQALRATEIGPVLVGKDVNGQRRFVPERSSVHTTLLHACLHARRKWQKTLGHGRHHRAQRRSAHPP